MKNLIIYLLSSANPLSAKNLSQIIGQNALVQSDFRILWSSISLERMHIFDFTHGDIRQGKLTYETTTSDWECLGMRSHTRTYLDMLRVPLVDLGM